MGIKNSEARETVLQRIREGLQIARFKEIKESGEKFSEFYVTHDKPLLELFADELTKISGEFYLCENEQELTIRLKKLHTDIDLSLCYSPDPAFEKIVINSGIPFIKEFTREKEIKSGISACEFLVARFGSVMISSALAGGRRIFSFPEIHIIIARVEQLVLELDEALDGISSRYGEKLPSQITNITGPSRTADIEKTLILGAHGPKKLIVYVLKAV